MADKKMGEKNKKPSAFKSYRMMNKRRRTFGAFSAIRGIIGIVLCVLFALFLMSGVINQKETGTTLMNYGMHIGQVIGAELNSVVEGKGLRYFKITDDGIYLKDVDVNKEDILEGTPLDNYDDANSEYGKDHINETREDDNENTEENNKEK